jgi:hypothetical protein
VKLRGGKTIPMPKGEVGRIAAKLVGLFSRCGADTATPPPGYLDNCVISRAGLRGRPIQVCAIPRSTNHWSQEHDLVLGGYYSKLRGYIQVEVNRDECAERKRWATEIRRVVRHELTHAADPYVCVRKKPYARRGTVVKKALKIEHAFLDPNICGYVLDPAEVTARLAQVEEELLSAETRHTIQRDVRKGILKPGKLPTILYESPTYMNIVPCLDKAPKVKRRFYQLAARLWAAGKLGPPPR